MSKKKGHSKDAPTRPVGGLAGAAGWPVYDVLLSRNWAEEGALITTLVARRSPASGKVAAALFLVDLACLGVKSAQVKMFKDAAEYAAGLRAHALRIQPMEPADFNLVAKIIFTGLDYAAALGFKPDPVYAQAQHLLSSAIPAANPTPVRTGGPEGKPLFVSGPYDDARQIVNHLLRTVGAGNFHYLVSGTAEELGLPESVIRRFEDAPQPGEQ
jgi:hypothetical protein